ncbi:hypothetical protein BBH88_17640 [Planococcus antarcticus DSM 14505]|uniref:Transcriptional regulator n=1 Tax=Planococcus antarcticus DSM 14505 TaxID=1185653 RepID=A0ABN4RND7_9BACL|nr:hypothetical protein [Planococcus antarcticus]ANU11944.1 hypothetical protein BBH88_17640 [Planococcus antarcticus DSM 14505]
MTETVKVGLIGPNDSVNETMKAAGSLEGIKLIPFIYQHTEETTNIINDNSARIGHWLFSGPAPYHFALKEKLIDADHADYILLHGSSLLGTMLDAIMQEGVVLSSISVDSVPRREVLKMLKDFDLEKMKIHTAPELGYIPAEELIDYHEKLYRSGEIQAALTCVHAAYTGLKERGVPVYRISVSELAAHRAISVIKERSLANLYRMKQLAMIGIEIIYPSQAQQHKSPFKIERQELAINRVLIDFAEEVKGSKVSVGNGIYFIYTTRGELELYGKFHHLKELQEEIFVNSNMHVRIGVGYGRTVTESEQNVRLALDYAREKKSGVVVNIDEGGKVTEINSLGDRLHYSRRSSEAKWQEALKDAAISQTVIARIESLSHRYAKVEVTALELSQWMNSTERNARRILTELESVGVAEVSGEESGRRGRPRKLYRLLFGTEK